MKSRTAAVILIVILIALICCVMAAIGLGMVVYWISNQTGDYDFWTSPQTGQMAPKFQLETIEGEIIGLNDFQGKPVMLNFWAIWCGPCIEEMPIIQDRYQKHHPDFVVLAIEENGNRVGVRDFIANQILALWYLSGANPSPGNIMSTPIQLPFLSMSMG